MARPSLQNGGAAPACGGRLRHDSNVAVARPTKAAASAVVKRGSLFVAIFVHRNDLVMLAAQAHGLLLCKGAQEVELG